MTDYNCPECGGPRMWDGIFDHKRNDCWIGDQDDATRYADAERLELSWGELTRLATEAEVALAEHIAGRSVTPEAQYRNREDRPAWAERVQTVVTRGAPGFAPRVIAGISVPEKVPS